MNSIKYVYICITVSINQSSFYILFHFIFHLFFEYLKYLHWNDEISSWIYRTLPATRCSLSGAVMAGPPFVRFTERLADITCECRQQRATTGTQPSFLTCEPRQYLGASNLLRGTLTAGYGVPLGECPLESCLSCPRGSPYYRGCGPRFSAFHR